MSVLRKRVSQGRCGWFKAWLGGRDRQPEKQATFRPVLECLEHREVMSATGFDPMQASLHYLAEIQHQVAIAQSDMTAVAGDVQHGSSSRMVSDMQQLQKDFNAGTQAITAAGYTVLAKAADINPMDTFNGALTPAEMRHAYGFDNLSFGNGTIAADGSGQTIAIVDIGDDPNITSDLHNFDVAYGLPDPNFTVSQQFFGDPGGVVTPDPGGGWEFEEALDVEWAHAMAPGANIILVATNNLFGGVQ